MKRFVTLIFLSLLFSPILAQEGETWETQQDVWDVTTIRILPNAGQQYLNNLRRTWVTAMEESKKLGLISDFRILSSVTDNSQGYNLMLVVHYPSLAALDATEERRAKWRQLDENLEKIISNEESQQISATVYPKVREILDHTLLREIKFKDE